MEQNEFEELINLYDEIKEFKINMSIEILSLYRSHHCIYEEFQEDHIIDKDFEKKIEDFSVKYSIQLRDNDTLCQKLNQILSGCNLILKLNDEDLKKIVSVHSNILNYILKNNDYNDYLKKILINRLVIEYFFPKSIIKRFKFKLSNLNEEDYRFSLSSTTICSYAIAKYANLWKENLKAKDYEDLIDLKSYYMYIVDSLGIFLKLIDNENLNNNTSYYNKNEFNSSVLSKFLPCL